MKTLTQLLEAKPQRPSGESHIPGDKQPVAKTPEPREPTKPNLELQPNTQLSFLDQRKIRKDQFKQENDQLMEGFGGNIPNDVVKQHQQIRTGSHNFEGPRVDRADPDRDVAVKDGDTLKVNPYAFFVEPNNKVEIPTVNSYIKDTLPWLEDYRDEEYLNRVLKKNHGVMNHEVYDHVLNGMMYQNFVDDEMQEFADGLTEGRITNPRIALNSLFRSNNADDGPLDVEGTKEFKRGIMEQLFHPHIQSEYEYDMLQQKLTDLTEDGGLDDKDLAELQRLSDLLIEQGYEFEAMNNPQNRGAITKGRAPWRTVDELEAALADYSFDPTSEAAIKTLLPRYGFGPYEPAKQQKENVEMLNIIDHLHGNPIPEEITPEGHAVDKVRGRNTRIAALKDRIVDENLPNLGADHPLMQEAWQERGNEAAHAYGKGAGLETYKRNVIADTFEDIEDQIHSDSPHSFMEMQRSIEDILSRPFFDTEISQHDKSYSGDNTRYFVHNAEHRGMWDNEALAPDGTPLRDAVTQDAQDVTWQPHTGEYDWAMGKRGNPFFPKAAGRKNTKNNFNAFFDKNQPLSQLRRKSNLVERYLDKFGGTLQDLLNSEQKQLDFQNWLGVFNLLDAKETWTDQILNDTAFPEGQVFQNLPLPGNSARRSGNARARLYERMGFGQPYPNEDESSIFPDYNGDPMIQTPEFQYGYKPFEGQNVQPGRIIPMDEQHGFTPTSRTKWRNDVTEANRDSELPLTRDFNPAYLGRHYGEAFSDEERDRIEGRMPPEEFLRAHHQMAAERFFEENDIDVPKEMMDALENDAKRSNALDRVDESVLEDFKEHLRSFTAQASQNPMGAMRLLSILEEPEFLDQFIETMYGSYLSQLPQREQP